MRKIVEQTLDQKRIVISMDEGEHLPVVYCIAQEDQELLKECEKLSCSKFHLVTIENVDWNKNLSPWEAGSVVTKNDGFTGQGLEFLNWILSKVVPMVERELEGEDHLSYIAGYSMAGLFALWSLYQTNFFHGAVCASGSLWFPDFEEFAIGNDLKRNPHPIYLSLGDRESFGRNPILKKTEKIYQNLADFYKGKGHQCFFEMNQGNHFQDVDLRLAKGVTWILNQ